MKYLKELTNDTLYTSWTVNVGGYNADQERRDVFDFFHDLSQIKTTDKITWVDPQSLKHIVEDWSRNGGSPDPLPYCSRDMCTAMAIVFSMPVQLKEDPRQNRIGLNITKRQYDNMYTNIRNRNGAWDLENAMTNPNKFQLTDDEHECYYVKYVERG